MHRGDRRKPGDPVVPHRRQKFRALKRAGTTTVPPVRKVASVDAIKPCTWNSGMRHKRNIVWTERVSCRDIACGSHQIAVPQRDAFGAPGAPAGMEHQRNIVRLGSWSDAATRHVRRGNRNTRLVRRAACSGIVLGRNDEDPGTGIGQIEGKLFEFIAGVQGRGCAGRRSGQECDDGIQPVGQRQSHAISAADAGLPQCSSHRTDAPPQIVVGDGHARIG